MKTKLLKEYLRLRKRPRLETGVISFVRHMISATFDLFPDTIRRLKKRCFTIEKQSLFYQKCVYNVQTMFVCVC